VRDTAVVFRGIGSTDAILETAGDDLITIAGCDAANQAKF
jgi:hypothetical protein